MPVEIRPVRDANEREIFVRLPREFYRHDTNWTPPLLSAERKLLDPDTYPDPKP